MKSQKGDVILASISFQGAFAVRCREASFLLSKKTVRNLLSLGKYDVTKAVSLGANMFFIYNMLPTKTISDVSLLLRLSTGVFME